MRHDHTPLRSTATPSLLVLAAAALLALAAGPPASAQLDGPPGTGYDGSDLEVPQGYDGSYAYVRSLEGSATLTQGDTGDRDELRINQPILVGDRIWVAPRGRVEVVLSDGNLLRVDSESELVFDALAGSPDREDRLTVLRLLRGNLQLVVVPDFLGDGLPRIDTPNATVYSYDLGTFRITTDAGDWTQVVAREGEAEVVTRTDSVLVREGEEVVVEGSRRTVERVARAGRLDSLELWGERLDDEARRASVAYVDESLRYEAASLDRYGSWVSIEGRYGWRPRVAENWRPYWQGRWVHSPAGFTWVSYEPWGWVPYHYGTWDYVPGYGWTWFPGSHFAPAWVYWYWTDHYVGWVPVGYYTHHYYPRFGFQFGFRFGHYGWAGGAWGHYRHWNFCHLGYFGRHLQHHHVYRGDRFGHHHRYAVPRRGLVTTDTRGVPRTAMRRPEQVAQVLAERARGVRGDLPDVTSFVARDELGRAARSRILVDPREAERGAKVLAADDFAGAVRRARSGDALATKPKVIDRGGAGDRSRAEAGRGPALATRPGLRPVPEAGDGRTAGRSPVPGTDRRGALDRDALRNRIERERAAGAGSDRRSVDPSWRERPAVVPDRSTVRGPGDRAPTDPGSSARERPPVPRRVIDGVRSGSGKDGSRDRVQSRPPSRDRVRDGVRSRGPGDSRSHSVRERAPSRSRSEGSTRSRKSSPPPRSRSADSTRSRKSSPPPRSRSSASSRSPSRRSSGVSPRSPGSRGRSSGVSSRSGSRSRSSGARSSGSSRSSGRSSKSRGRPPGF